MRRIFVPSHMLVAVALCCFALAIPAHARIYYVDQNAAGGIHDGNSWVTAYLAINNAMSLAASGDEIWVAAAAYVERITLTDGVALYGGFVGTETTRYQRNWRTNTTTINGNQEGSVVTVPGGGTVDGFTITNGRAGEGAGIYCTGTGAPTITNNIVTANICTTYGAAVGGIYCLAGSHAVIINNRITSNVSYGVGMAGGAPVTISNNWISDNDGGVLCKYPMNASANVVGNTIVDNGYTGIYCYHQPFTLANNIVAYCTGVAIYVSGSGGEPTVQNNCLFGNSTNYYGISAGSGDIYDDPAFVDTSGGDYHITGSSSCLNAGISSASGVASIDIDGQVRIYDIAIDIGADEFCSPFIYKPQISPGTGTYNQTQSVTITCDTAGAVIHYTTNGSEPTESSPTVASGGTVSVTTSLTLKAKAFKTGLPPSSTTTGIYTLVASDPTFSPDGYVGTVSPQTVTVSCASVGCTVHYTTNGIDPTTSDPVIASGGTLSISQSTVLKAKAFRTGWTSSGVKTSVYRFGNRQYVWNVSPGSAHDGFSWQTAFQSITAALSGAVSGDEIWVAQGTYVENITMKDGVSLYGGFVGNETSLSTRNWKANETIIDGNQASTVILVPDTVTTSSRIDGFTIRNGKTEETLFQGGGITCDGGSLVITNNKITGNVSTGNGWVTGGGINFCNSNSIVTNNIISGNIANFGGGFCTSNSFLTITNNTIVDNTAVYDGGGIYLASSPSTMENNIIAFNSSGIYQGQTAPPTLDHNCVYGNTSYDYSGLSASAHDISANPQFVDRAGADYHLSSTSPCRDVGLNTAPGIPSDDMDAQSRIGNTAVDIGADEYWPMVATPTLTPDSGTYNSTQSVVIHCATSMAMMHYTTNGNIPTESDTPIAEGGTISVNGNAILRVKAWKSGLQPSYVKTGIYNLASATPSFNPAGGTFNTTKNVLVTCSTAGVTIHYTINGLEPTESDPTVASGSTVAVNQSLTLKAKAFKTGWTPSEARSADFTLVAAIPTFSPDGGTYSTGQSVTVNCTSPGVTIHYTTNGTDPTESDPAVASGGIILVQYTSTLKAKAFRTGWTASGVKSASYTITTVATPQLSPDGGISNRQIDVTVTCVTPDATIHYTTNGVDPTESDPIVVSGSTIAVNQSLTLKAKAFKSGLTASATKSADYTITNVLYVDVNASGPTYDGLTWQSAFTTIDDAIGIAVRGNEIWVAGGEYFLYRSLLLTDQLSLYGGFAGNETSRSQRDWVAHASQLRIKVDESVVVVDKGASWDTVISGFTIMDGNADFGGGIDCTDASPTIENNIITGNTASTDGGGIYVGGDSAPNIYNNLIIFNNSVRFGGAICCVDSEAKIINNTILNNTAADGSGIACLGDRMFSLANNIIAFNDSGIFCDGCPPDLVSNYVGQNSVYDYLGLDPGPTDIIGEHDPGFVDYDNGDYHLMYTSSCVDRGDSSLVPTGWVDMDAKERISGSSVDVGAYECGLAATPSFSPDGCTSNRPIDVVISCSLSGATIHYTTNGLDPTESDPTIASGGSIAISSTTTLKARSFKAGWSPSAVKTAQYTITNLVYVWDSAPGPTHDGMTWQTACLSVSDGIHFAVTGNEIWVAAGHYYDNITLPAEVCLYGGFVGNETARYQRNWNANATILDGDRRSSVITVASNATTATVIDGFVIENGYAERGGGICCVECSPTITNNVIRYNGSNECGSGVYCDRSSAAIKNNIFDGNYGPIGSAIALEGESLVSMVNNTFVRNESKGGGAVSSRSSSLPEMVNNIVAFNQSGIYCDSASIKLYNNCIYGNVEFDYIGIEHGRSDINDDPHFVDFDGGNLHLSENSCCIDSGTNRHTMVLDLDGAIRPQDGDIDTTAAWDIGAYEYPLNLYGAKNTYPEGSAIAFGGAAVTAQMTGSIYVERVDRTAGIRVDTTDTFTVGTLVNVSGQILVDSISGECYIAASAPWPEPMSGQCIIRPFGFVNKSLGGGPCGIQDGISDGYGLNNIGLLVTVFGNVTAVDTSSPRRWFIIDDGSSVGVKVTVPLGVTINPVWQFATVRGISSCEKVGENLCRVIICRDQADISAL